MNTARESSEPQKQTHIKNRKSVARCVSTNRELHINALIALTKRFLLPCSAGEDREEKKMKSSIKRMIARVAMSPQKYIRCLEYARNTMQ